MASSIKSYLLAIRHLQISMGHPDPHIKRDASLVSGFKRDQNHSIEARGAFLSTFTHNTHYPQSAEEGMGRVSQRT